ncbi:DUF2125 domain-containing protein [Haematobacter massiliensis]|nr:DUF2125 domain-containing protein [Haematobacter massiliensis]QBJ24798.1 DUF2125 domain-containing protein [Haematobacter massiliensis]
MKGKTMRFILGFAVLLLLGWTGWWFFAASKVKHGATAFIAEQQQRGMAIEHQGLSVRGFPYRFDLELTAPEIHDPRSGYGWEAPFLRLQALAYQPNHIIATLPDSQTVYLPDQTLTLASSRMQGSIRTRLPPGMALQRLVTEGEAVTLSSDRGWTLGMPKVVAALQPAAQAGAAGNTYDLALSAAQLAPGGTLRLDIDPRSRLPDAIDTVTLDASLLLDAPLDRAMFDRNAVTPEIQAIGIRDAGVVWGNANLRLSGDLAMDTEGLADGTLHLRVSGWETILNIVIALGIVPEENRSVAEVALRVMAGTTLGAKTLDVPLRVSSGVVFLGPVPLTTIPPVLREQRG